MSLLSRLLRGFMERAGVKGLLFQPAALPQIHKAARSLAHDWSNRHGTESLAGVISRPGVPEHIDVEIAGGPGGSALKPGLQICQVLPGNFERDFRILIRAG